MKPEELRIGNWVYVRTNGNYEQVHRIHENFGTFIDPIPLTEEWLLKFGFNKSGIEWIGKICLEQRDNEIYYSAGEGIKLSENIKHVHQLQNLYFALTGEELKINNHDSRN